MNEVTRLLMKDDACVYPFVICQVGDCELCWGQGSRCRATASTGMNQRSSRSHAIFTITVEQRRAATIIEPEQAEGDDSGDEEEGAANDYLCAKMHLVDLAG